MGQSSLQKSMKKKREILNGAINDLIICPFCSTQINSNYNYDQLNNHLQECGSKYYDLDSNQICSIYLIKDDPNLNQIVLNDINLYRSNARINKKENIDFNVKIEELHKEIRKKKISWEEGAEILNINRANMRIIKTN